MGEGGVVSTSKPKLKKLLNHSEIGEGIVGVSPGKTIAVARGLIGIWETCLMVMIINICILT